MILTAFVLWARAMRRCERALTERRYEVAENQVCEMYLWTAFIAIGGLVDGLVLMAVMDYAI